MEGCSFSNNSADLYDRQPPAAFPGSGMGGAICLIDSYIVRISYSRFAQNIVVYEPNERDKDKQHFGHGGAIGALNSRIDIMYATVFERNQAHTAGGALFLSSSSYYAISSCTFANNIQRIAGYNQAGGGAIASIAGTNITNCTFRSNVGYKGGALDWDGGLRGGTRKRYTFHLNAVNNSFLDNHAKSDGGAIFFDYFTRRAPVAFVALSKFSNNSALGKGAHLFTKTLKGNSFFFKNIFEDSEANFNAGVSVCDAEYGILLEEQGFGDQMCKYPLSECEPQNRLVNLADGYKLEQFGSYGCTCPSYRYMHPYNATTCSLNEGYWVSGLFYHYSETLPKIFKCYNPHACKGGPKPGEASCDVAYTGKQCRSCAQGFTNYMFVRGRDCSPCLSILKSWAILCSYFVLYTGFFVFTTSKNLKHESGKRNFSSVVLKLIFAHWQVMKLGILNFPLHLFSADDNLQAQNPGTTPAGFGLDCLLQKITAIASTTHTYALLQICSPFVVALVSHIYWEHYGRKHPEEKACAKVTNMSLFIHL